MKNLDRAISHIDREGLLLLYPHQNKPLPKSLWSCIHPKSKMKWEWDDSMDNKVFKQAFEKSYGHQKET